MRVGSPKRVGSFANEKQGCHIIKVKTRREKIAPWRDFYFNILLKQARVLYWESPKLQLLQFKAVKKTGLLYSAGLLLLMPQVSPGRWTRLDTSSFHREWFCLGLGLFSLLSARISRCLSRDPVRNSATGTPETRYRWSRRGLWRPAATPACGSGKCSSLSPTHPSSGSSSLSGSMGTVSGKVSVDWWKKHPLD